MNELAVQEKNGVQTVSARELHEKLEITDRFSRWFDSLLKYGFENGPDFTSVKTSTLVNNGAKKVNNFFGNILCRGGVAKHTPKKPRLRKYTLTREREEAVWNAVSESLQEMRKE